MELTDEILIAGIKRDDYSSYNQLFMRYYSRLCAFVFNLTQNYSASERCCSGTFHPAFDSAWKTEITESTSG